MHLDGMTAFLVAVLLAPVMAAGERERPVMSDLMGVCAHFHFDAPTYAAVARHVRNYHSVNWDLDVTKPYQDPPYPFALNRVNWETLYGGWQAAGFEIDASVMFGNIAADDWGDLEVYARGYGKAFASFLGPSNKGLVRTAELGNEPGKYSDEQFTRIARAMAEGMNEGDPLLRIATAALVLGESGDSGALKVLEAHRNDPDPAVARCAARFTGNGDRGARK